MTRTGRLRLALFACAILAMGCGGDREGGSQQTVAREHPPRGEGTAKTARRAAEAPAQGRGDQSRARPARRRQPLRPSPAQRERLERTCLEQVRTSPHPRDVKRDLAEVCEHAASGDADAVGEASRALCRKLVERRLPAGPARDPALEACDRARPAPAPGVRAGHTSP